MYVSYSGHILYLFIKGCADDGGFACNIREDLLLSRLVALRFFFLFA
jgi:hypothetical protein